MKKIGFISAALIAALAMTFVLVFSCEREETPDITINGYKMAKGVIVKNTVEADDSYTQPDVKAALRKLNEGQKDFSQDFGNNLDSTCGVLFMHTTGQWVFNNMLQEEVGIGLYLTPCAGAPTMSSTVTVGALSIVVDYDVQNCTLMPFDYNSINSDILNALTLGMGALLTNNVTSTGKFYFAWYCLSPITISTNQNDLFKLRFDNVLPGTPIIFDQAVQGNLSVSSTGWDEMQLIISNATL